ncbi:MAG: class I mannose-6-phosphate isomerase [Herpetosiphon sp.]
MLSALRLIPVDHQRVWGGNRLKAASPPIGERWCVYEQNRVANGPEKDRTLAELSRDHGAALLGTRVMPHTGGQFPLLIKLLDTADWLSIQVHPDDEQARRLEGPGSHGKTEAWHMLEVVPGAEVIYGLRPGVGAATLAQSVQSGTLSEIVQTLPVHPGDSLFTRAGTIHALGPGLLLYELQQSSDITYRVFDWNRPAAAGRSLHVEKSLAVIDRGAADPVIPLPMLADGDHRMLLRCPYFALELIGADSTAVTFDTAGETFHALTCTEGRMEVVGAGWSETLSRFESLIVPAAVCTYTINPLGRYRALKASVEPE